MQFFGTIIAPAYISGWTGCVGNSWLLFSNVDNLMINGSGKIDGQGENWWNKPKEHHKHKVHISHSMCILTLPILHHDIGNQTLIYVQEIIRYQSLDFQGKGNCYSPTVRPLFLILSKHIRKVIFKHSFSHSALLLYLTFALNKLKENQGT